MTVLWGNPLALFGLLGISVPILVHLLATRRAARLPFPTLRFLPESTPTAMRRRRIEDLALLALRCLIIAVAVAALAQPWLLLGDRRSAPDSNVARAVVVDTSASMARSSGSGQQALGEARRLAAELVDEAASSTIIETPDLRAGVGRAALWLAGEDARRGRPEVVVVSDFQSGSIDGVALERLPARVGIRLQQLTVAADRQAQLPVVGVGNRLWSATATLDDDATSVTWVDRPIGDDESPPPFDWLASAEESAGAQAAMAAAARTVAVPGGLAARPVTVVWPQAPDRARLLANAGPLSAPWMADVLAGMPADVAVVAAGSSDRLLLFADAVPGSLESAQLAAALLRAGSTGAEPVAELEPRVIAAEMLGSWLREAGDATSPAGSDGRWLWLLALGLLLLEQYVRRTVAHVD